ncbi:MAG: LamG domain-containing protein, partial [Planctomycetia bacterium]|nr:LamG domain-containing protein [Planctomycetia bacterium]
APIAAADAEVLADRPLAVWRFAEPDGGKQAVAERFAHDGNRSLPNDSGQADQLPIADLLASAERLPADRDGTVVFAEPGPRPPRHPAFASDNAAALFGSGRGFLRVSAKTARFDEFQFTAGDSITLEAWVNPFGVADGQQVYIIGKGRTGRSGFAKENQNWSLRLASRGGLARPSFLFREVAERVDSNKHYHRWIASEGFEPGTGWHHVAVSYTFGEKDSLRGYLDGRPVEGKWDAGGATAASPVVDDDEVWIGSSLGGSSASTFAGLLDNVAVHRQTLSPERIAARWQVDETVPAFEPVELAPVPDGRVLFELVEGVPDVNGWGFAPREPAESFTRTSFALTELPQYYNDSGVRADRKLPLVLRARARL